MDPPAFDEGDAAYAHCAPSEQNVELASPSPGPPTTPDQFAPMTKAPPSSAASSSILETPAKLDQASDMSEDGYENVNELRWEQASAMAATLRDANVQLAAENDTLRGRVAELEAAMAACQVEMSKRVKKEGEEGNEQLISALQVEVANLEHQVIRAHRAKRQEGEEAEAAAQRAR